MTKKERAKRAILIRKLESRITGSMLWKEGDVVRLVHNTWDGLLPGFCIGKIATIIRINREIYSFGDWPNRWPLLLGIRFFRSYPGLHRNVTELYSSRRRKAREWWADPEALELIRIPPGKASRGRRE